MTISATIVGTNTDRGEMPAEGDEATDLGDRTDLHALLGITPTGRPRCLRRFRPGWIVLLGRALNHPAALAVSPRAERGVLPIRAASLLRLRLRSE
ncbi:hypothetical protein [Candidatus Chloroploca asiatica]|uniref:Uncharacterized protein n=1 Tax=Candidatus Chloroploca asiatica TaxID=1506545 RepID=A0A2H3KQB5_9CHLR|nr:hypothetical protein [Candidatus Chloroploca asiatica]PDV99671.1 hypothetical protein A9Q02_00145 [Candidatus Chloroploca asiatica]